MGHVLIFLFLDYYWIECKIINGKKKGLLKNILALGFCIVVVSCPMPLPLASWLDAASNLVFMRWAAIMIFWKILHFRVDFFNLFALHLHFFNNERRSNIKSWSGGRMIHCKILKNGRIVCVLTARSFMINIFLWIYCNSKGVRVPKFRDVGCYDKIASVKCERVIFI